MGDFSHGPIVLLEGKPCQTHLSAWIDSHSRYIVDARYYLRENLDILVDSLLRAWAKHGSPRELYADNGKVYHANGLTVACAKLNIRKLHRPPREPEPGGVIERFFQTVQSQFSSEVDASKTLTFKELNQAFEAWLQAAYHQQVNRITGQRPHDRYFTEYRLVRTVPITEVESYFYQSQPRRVDLTYCDVSIDKRQYKVDLRLLVSSAIDVAPPLKILLVGQEHIRQTLKRSEYTDIVNRISVRYQLRPLTKEQTCRYIDYQVAHHGGGARKTGIRSSLPCRYIESNSSQQSAS